MQTRIDMAGPGRVLKPSVRTFVLPLIATGTEVA